MRAGWGWWEGCRQEALGGADVRNACILWLPHWHGHAPLQECSSQAGPWELPGWIF